MDTLSAEEVALARATHLRLAQALDMRTLHSTAMIPATVLGCREFLAEVLARVSATHHTPSQAELAFQGLMEELQHSVNRNIKALQTHQSLNWLPGSAETLDR